MFEADGPIELVSELTGCELQDKETEAVFALLDVLCREAVVRVGGEEAWVRD